MYKKIAFLENSSYSRRNCILLHHIPENKDEVTDDVGAKTICKNINDNIITVDDIGRSHRIGKYNPRKKYPTPVIAEFARYNVRDRLFSNKRNLKGKQISIFESLTKLRLMKLKEARDQYTFSDV